MLLGMDPPVPSAVLTEVTASVPHQVQGGRDMKAEDPNQGSSTPTHTHMHDSGVVNSD